MNSVAEIENMVEDGDTHFLKGDWNEAESFYKNVLNSTQGRTEKDILLLRNKAYDGRAKICEKTSKWGCAIREVDKSLNELENTNEHGPLADAYYRKASILWRVGYQKGAFEHYQKGEDAARKANDDKRIAIALRGKGLILTEMGDFDEALNQFDDSIKLTQDPIEMGKGYNNRGLVFEYQDEFSVALENYEKARDYGEKSGYKELEGHGLVNSGKCLQLIALLKEKDKKKINAEKGLKYAEKAESIFLHPENPNMLGGVNLVYALAKVNLDKLKEAKEYFNDSLKLFIKSESPVGMGIHYYYRGLVSREQNNNAEAKEYLELGMDSFNSAAFFYKADEIKKIIDTL